MNTKKKRSHARAKGMVNTSISLPATMLAEIDAAAQADRRKRSQWIVVALEKALLEEAAKAPYLPSKSPAAASPHKENRSGAA